MYPYPPCFCFIISLIWNALVKIWKDLYFSHCNWSISPWTCCNSGLGWWQMSVSDHSQTKPICWRSFPFFLCLIWVNSRRFATSACTFMDQRWSLFSAPSYSFSLYNSFSIAWDCGNVSVGWSSSLHTDWRTYLVVLDKWYHWEMIIIQNGYLNQFISYGCYHDQNKIPAYHRGPVHLNREPCCFKIFFCLLRDYRFFKSL